ncbi:BtrH N-terminal domain-containing protein [candidate division KSB1 bacterium]|nr:BtrH N-terminal domain-containing protein [candidate division KSB1 bacterium]
MKHIIKNFKPLAGKHCITNSIRQILMYHGKDLSEDMIFGLGAGLSFFYMENKAADFPIISARIKPLDFEKNLAGHMKIAVEWKKTKSIDKAYDALVQLVTDNKPVLIYVDMALLDYLGMPADAHFGGHSLVVFGIDEEEGVALVSDRDGDDAPLNVNGNIVSRDFHKITLELLAAARSSTYPPFPAENKWFTFNLDGFEKIKPDHVRAAIRTNATEFLNPPIKNIGVEGIRKFARQILNWSKFNDNKLCGSVLNCYFMIDATGGTGGGAFRKMYGHFLLESSFVLMSTELSHCAKEFLGAGKDWDIVARLLKDVYDTEDRSILVKISEKLDDIADREEKAMRMLLELSGG